MMENWDEVLLEWYGDVEVEVQTLEETNEEWCKCFMTDLKTQIIWVKAA